MEAIVVGIDGTTSGQAALEWAAAEARERSARLIVVHAWHVPTSAYGSAGAYGAIPSLYPVGEVYASSARRTLEDALARIDVTSISGGVEEHLVNGDPAIAIADAAEEASASLIVLGDRRRSALGALLAGSTGRDIARRAAVPIVVVPYVNDDAATPTAA